MHTLNELIYHLCKSYQLGELTSQPNECLGGLLHQIYQFDTAQGQYIIKVINPSIIKLPHAKERYRITENIARKLSQKVSAISAILYHEDPLFTFENYTVMLFPYINGNTISQNQIQIKHVEHIAHALSQIHKTNLNIVDAPHVEFPKIQFIEINKSIPDHDLATESKSTLSIIETIYENCKRYKSILTNNLVISHRDLDPKNVLWDENSKYYIIDWESSGFINETKDILATAIYWSLDDAYQIRLDYLSHFLKIYQNNNKSIDVEEIESGFYGLLGDWLTWLDFNLSRIINHPNDSHDYLLGVKESKNTLKAIPLLYSQLPMIKALITIHNKI